MRQDVAHRAFAIATSAFLATLASTASARPTGEAQECFNCHYETEGPIIDLRFANESPATGETVALTLELEAVNAEALRTGMYITATGGEFVLVEPDSTRYAEDGVLNEVLHSEPRDLDGSGQAQFALEWIAPEQIGVAEFTVWSMTGNSNGDSADDHHATRSYSIAHGCDGVYYHLDEDGDGFGDVESAVLSCEPIAGRIEQGGDCNDTDAAVNPTATERCNAVDDNCDGTADEGLEPGIYYPDPDGDGYAGSLNEPEFTCNDQPGYAPEGGDCAPDDPEIYPGAPERANGRDDNCNGEIDEGISDEDDEEIDSDSDGSGGESGDVMPGANDDGGGDGGGCRVHASERAGGAALGLWVLLLGLGLGARRRRSES